ncbi:MAG: sodium:solute symporter family protein [Bryobacterales bacterium]|nr:sodium:solute symporter family protein [Bryobacterales bacterium]
MGLSTIDLVVLGAYFVLILAVGILLGLRVKSTESYFLGERRFGRLVMIGMSFGVGTHSEMPVAVAGAVYSTGLSAIWFQWKNLFATPFYWLLAPLFRRIRRTTTAELTEERYGRWMGGIYTVFALIFFVIGLASMLKGAAKVIAEATGGGINVNEIVIGMTVAFMVYSFVGGMVATAWTNLFQGVLILALSFMLVPLGWSAAGGMDGMRSVLEEFKFSLATPEGIGPWVILMLTVNGLVGIAAQPHILASVGTGQDERTCREGFFLGNLVKRACTLGWALVGLIVAALLAQGKFGGEPLADPELAFGFAARHLLFPGGIGLLIAGILAANMSTCSAFMIDAGALFTQGFYRKYVKPGVADSHYLWIGRTSGVAITLLGVVYSLFLIDQVLYAFLLTETLATYIGISLLGGIVWRRANRWGAMASIATAMGVNFTLYWLRGERLDHWDANVFCASLIAGIAALVVVSLMTRPEPEAQSEDFFARLETPSDSGARGDKPLLVVHLLHLRKAAGKLGIWRAYAEDLRGWAAGMAVCWALVLATWLYFR